MRRNVAYLLCLLSGAAAATTWYVQPATGEYGSEDGSSLDNSFDGLADINAACASIQPGDIVRFHGHFVAEQLIPCPGSANGRVTYTYYDAENPPIFDGDASGTSVLSANNKDYWDLVGPFIVKNSSTTIVNIFGGSSDITIDGVICTGQLSDTSFCIRGRDMRNWEVKNSHVHDSHGSGIAADIGAGAGGGYNIWIHDNETRYNTYRGIVVTGAVATGDIYHDVTINANLSCNNGDGIYVAAVDGFKIFKNQSCENTDESYVAAEGYGIGVQQSKNGRIYLNDISANDSEGVEVWGDAAGPSTNVWTFANFIRAHKRGDQGGGNAVEYATHYSAGGRIFGNVLVGNVRGIRIAGDTTKTSAAFGNILAGNSSADIQLADSGGVALTGWTFADNILASPMWFNGARNDNSLSFLNNDYYGGSGTYNQVAYTTANIASLDPTAKTVDPDFLGGNLESVGDWRPLAEALYGVGLGRWPMRDIFGAVCDGQADIGAFCNGVKVPFGHRKFSPRRMTRH